MSTFRFRSGPAKGVTGKVDRATGNILGAAVIKLGEAKGHGMEIDSKTLDQIVTLGNAAPDGVLIRYGHPGMCDDAMASKLGRATNYVRDGDTVRADLKIGDYAKTSPKGDLYAHTFDLAEQDPNGFGLSVAIEGKPVWKFADGTERSIVARGEKPPAGALNKLPAARPHKLRANDTVDDPAATDGLFGADPVDIADILAAPAGDRAETAFAALDEMLADPRLGRDRAVAFLNRYAHARGFSLATAPAIPTAPTPTPANKESTMSLDLKALLAKHPNHKALVADQFSNGKTEAEIAEAVYAAQFAALTESSAKVVTELAAEKAEHVKTKDALAKLQTKHDALAALKTGTPPDVGGSADAVALEGLAGDDLWKAEFKTKPDIRAKFALCGEAGYLAHKRAEAIREGAKR